MANEKKIGTYSPKPTEEDMRLKIIDHAIRNSWPEELVDAEHPILFDKGEIIVDPETGEHERLPPSLRPDYTLRFDKDTLAAFVEAKNTHLPYDNGIHQARRYADLQKLKFAYSTNGREINPETNWGIREFDFIKLEKEISLLMQDEDVTKKKGIYSYVLTRKEKHLNIRTFSDNQKREAYERQKGICAFCSEEFELNEMEADHITPWHEGGKTIAENCQMLCRDDNRRKSGK